MREAQIVGTPRKTVCGRERARTGNAGWRRRGKDRSLVVAAGCSAGEGRIEEVGKEQVFPNPLPTAWSPAYSQGAKLGEFGMLCDQGLKLTSAVFI